MKFFKNTAKKPKSYSFLDKKHEKKDEEISAVRKLRPIGPPADKNRDLEMPPSKVFRYKREKCLQHDENGMRCSSMALPDSVYCKHHGGHFHKVPALTENNIENSRSGKAVNLSIYDPSFHPISYIELARTGLSDAEIAMEFGVSTATLIDWSTKHAQFSTALEVGKTAYEAYFLRVGRINLSNDRFNNGLFKFLAMNKLGYSDKVESKNTNLSQHGVLLIPPAMTIQEWEAQCIKYEEDRENGAGDISL